ncbi:Transcriptional regulator protein [Novosphingobium sp. Rr 2-17]|uniref:TetR/AcrR family transcriptional regulator n=1 Tax=Novosphingobium sp. Rr 2-17 TaxID=555793 RepID=UPI0002697B92|nr:TetR/AcrR family transcriptional regulator [Novosphingobium sp. Rr 2-17]EIZ78318.1 Transcriptional regulator protein [Novosphingobium sp. Rr 2-17]
MKTAEVISDERADKVRMPGRPQSEELDRAILDAALESLSDVGFEALSIAAVARGAQTTPPAIYRRFTDKTKLVLAALEHDLAAISDTDADHGSLQADLRALILSIFEALSPRRTRVLASLTLQARANPEPLEFLSRTIHRLGSRYWGTIIGRAVTRGELAHNEIPEVIGRIPGALAIHFALLQDSPRDDGAITELIEAVMLPALFAAAGPLGFARPEAQPQNSI